MSDEGRPEMTLPTGGLQIPDKQDPYKCFNFFFLKSILTDGADDGILRERNSIFVFRMIYVS